MSDANSGSFQLAGLDRGRFQAQVAEMIASQRKQKRLALSGMLVRVRFFAHGNHLPFSAWRRFL
jgi:hypothetical protein